MRTVRDTSALAFRELKASNKLGDLQQRALQLITDNPGKTANELRAIEQEQFPNADHEYYESLDKRFSELERWKAVVSKDKRVCSISGMRCYTWFPTGADPVKPPMREDKRKVLDTSGLLLRTILRRMDESEPVKLVDIKDLMTETVEKIKRALEN